MQNKIEISVVIPTYNRADKLLNAVRSVLAQSYPVMEILVCDDGSTDDSKVRITELKNDKVKWIDCGRNGMPSVPRNMGIEQSKGNWIAFLDSDDEWMPEKLETQVGLITINSASASCSNAFIARGSDRSIYHLKDTPKTIGFLDLVHSNYIICSSVLIKKDVLIRTGNFPIEKELKALEDFALWLRIAVSTPFVYADQPLLVYLDEASDSIRDRGQTTGWQRKTIFRSFRNWARKNKIVTKEMFKAIEHEFLIKDLDKKDLRMYKLFKVF